MMVVKRMLKCLYEFFQLPKEWVVSKVASWSAFKMKKKIERFVELVTMWSNKYFDNIFRTFIQNTWLRGQISEVSPSNVTQNDYCSILTSSVTKYTHGFLFKNQSYLTKIQGPILQFSFLIYFFNMISHVFLQKDTLIL